MWIWRLAWHAGFGGTSTVETDDPAAFLKELRTRTARLDWIEVTGGYAAEAAPDDLNVQRTGASDRTPPRPTATATADQREQETRS